MARKEPRPPAKLHERLSLTIVVRRCRNQTCSRYQQACRPEEEGRWALPHGECGLDLIAQVGALRYREHRSISEIHQHLQERHIQICERTARRATPKSATEGWTSRPGMSPQLSPTTTATITVSRKRSR